MTFVLDASTTLAWAFVDEDSETSRVALDRLQEATAVVPVIWLIEVANALLVAERRGRLTADQSARFVEFISGLPIEVDTVGLETVFDRALPLARVLGLSVYDAMYLDLARRDRVPLVTLDRRLADAARRMGVPLLEETVA
ncbi:MAG: type II toxin-antitoxin system VapC family toxin [Thermomicrobiales bacterium]|nr:type II toxin-antitoxin system VapC family toxin [Thermomicrobiales bacterium]